MNSVSKSIGDARQTQMLETISKILSEGQSQGREEFKSAFDGLNYRLTQLQAKLSSAENNAGNSDLLATALKGRLGDSIARLDMDTAVLQLDNINEQLKKLKSAVDNVKKDTSEIIRSISTLERNQNRQNDEANRRRERFNQAIFDSPDNLIETLRPRVLYGGKGHRRHAKVEVELLQPEQRVAMDGEPPALRALEWATTEVILVLSDTSSHKEVYNAASMIDRRQVAGRQEFNFLTHTDPAQELTICLSVLDPLRKKRIYLTQSFAMRKDSFDFKYEMLAPMRMSETVDKECAYIPLIKIGKTDSLHLPSIDMVRLNVEDYQSRLRKILAQVQGRARIPIVRGSQTLSPRIAVRNPALAQAIEKTQTWWGEMPGDFVEVTLVFQNLRMESLNEIVLDIHSDGCATERPNRYMTYKFNRSIRPMEVVALQFQLKMSAECKTEWSIDVVDADIS